MLVVTKCTFCGNIINLPDKDTPMDKRQTFIKSVGYAERRIVRNRKVREYFHLDCLYQSKD